MEDILYQFIKNLDYYNDVGSVSKPEKKMPFEDIYISTREKENRIYKDEVVKDLPTSNKAEPAHEWKMRAKSTARILHYFQSYHTNMNVLDLGCGNGWFTASMAQNPGLKLFGLDINRIELEQAARVFEGKATFLYGDIFKMDFPLGVFGAVTINAAVQYFPDLNKLLERLFSLMTTDGEVHIIDSPFYTQDEIQNARERSVAYYTSMGSKEMVQYYFHHSLDDLTNWKIEKRYDPATQSNLMKIFGKRDNPFPWICIMRK